MASPTPAALLMLARELRDAAANAGRPDVMAKADEAIALIVGPAEPETRRDGDKGNVVVRLLDGMGL